jgi:type VI secretion system protein VasG
MSSHQLKTLIRKLNPLCRQTLEAAAGSCLSASHYCVEVEHWLLKLIESAHSDVALLLAHYDVDTQRVVNDLQQRLSRLKSGNAQPPALSQSLVSWIQQALLVANLHYETQTIRSAFLLHALLHNDGLSGLFGSVSPSLEKIPLDQFDAELLHVIQASKENPSIESPNTVSVSSTPALDQYTVNLTQLAQQGKIDAVIGREQEISQVIDILTRRRQNNPILTGEPGVGKTAVVEGLALRIAHKQVPASLQAVVLRTLDLGLLQAGAGIKGEFENRLKAVISEVKSSPQPIVLFIDEAHTLVGAGAQAGQTDAANLLKPALARGELRTIAATTWAEYKKYFEQDAALTRRFQVVKVEEPSEETALHMLRGLLPQLEQHHGVRILDEAIAAAVRLSHHYISHRQLPDKAISVLDTACARLAIRESDQAPALQEYQSQLTQVETALQLLQREAATSTAHQQRLTTLQTEQQRYQQQLLALEQRWQHEKELITKIRALRHGLEKNALPASKQKTGQRKLQQLVQQLKMLQQPQPLLQDCVDAQCVAEVIANWTGIPLGRMVNDEIQTVLQLEGQLQQRIMGQNHALYAIAQHIQMARAQLTDPNKPVACFLFVGPSGVGKTETAMALADLLYGGYQNMTVINLSEFKEEHKVSLLLGAPPGYVGYGDGGILTEAVRRRPYSLALLDEVEKAHPGVQDIFYQVFDKGVLRDGQGRDVNFKNTVLILTSNVAGELITQLCADPKKAPDLESLIAAIRPELLKVFKPAFLARLTIVPYLPLTDDLMRQVVQLQLQRIVQRVNEHYAAELTYESSLVEAIAARCLEVQSGARNINHLLTGQLLPELSTRLLSRTAEDKKTRHIHISVNGEQGFEYRLT